MRHQQVECTFKVFTMLRQFVGVAEMIGQVNSTKKYGFLAY